MESVDAVPVRKFMTDAEQLAELCEKLDRKGAEVEWQEAQLCFVNAETRWRAKKDFTEMAEVNRAEERLIRMFMEGALDRVIMRKAWSAYRKALFSSVRHKA